jgi:hypothetical protein
VDEPDIERLIKELAATGVDPFWVVADRPQAKPAAKALPPAKADKRARR